jgi:hypothetical protein
MPSMKVADSRKPNGAESLTVRSAAGADVMLINDEVVRRDSAFSQFLLKYYDHYGNTECG